MDYLYSQLTLHSCTTFRYTTPLNASEIKLTWPSYFFLANFVSIFPENFFFSQIPPQTINKQALDDRLFEAFVTFLPKTLIYKTFQTANMYGGLMVLCRHVVFFLKEKYNKILFGPFSFSLLDMSSFPSSLWLSVQTFVESLFCLVIHSIICTVFHLVV